jgi:hypothetical protein
MCLQRSKREVISFTIVGGVLQSRDFFKGRELWRRRNLKETSRT